MTVHLRGAKIIDVEFNSEHEGYESILIETISGDRLELYAADFEVIKAVTP
jgi:hypothetical protein